MGRFGKRLISKEELLADLASASSSSAGIEVEQGVKVTGIDGEDGRFAVETERGPVPAAQGGARHRPARHAAQAGRARRGAREGRLRAHRPGAVRRREGARGRRRRRRARGGDPARRAERRGGDALVPRRRARPLPRREPASASRRSLRRDGSRRSSRRRCGRSGRARWRSTRAARGAALENDFVIVNVGGELPLEFLAKAGVSLRRYHGEAPGEARRREGSAPARRRRRRTARSGCAAAPSASCTRSPARRSSPSSPGRGGTTTPCARVERLQSPLHPGLKSAGPWGHGVGIAATAFMLSNFLYAARKRWKRLGGAREHPGLARLPRVRGLHEPARHRLPRRVPVEQPPRQRHRRGARASW